MSETGREVPQEESQTLDQFGTPYVVNPFPLPGVSELADLYKVPKDIR
jgi:hypothetical protein